MDGLHLRLDYGGEERRMLSGRQHCVRMHGHVSITKSNVLLWRGTYEEGTS